MSISKDAILAQIDAVLGSYEEARRRSAFDDISDLGAVTTSEILTRLARTIQRLAPTGSRYRENARESLERYGSDNAYNVPILVGVLRALRADYDSGYLQGVETLLRAELFADFLEMAEHLLEQGYKDPAAVLAGGVLEEHLRKLCIVNGIPVSAGSKPKKADLMNAELAAADVYNRLDQKAVTAWLDLRNKAAHGNYSDYTIDQVRMLIPAIRDFMARHV